MKNEIKKISNEDLKDDKPIEKLLIINSKKAFEMDMQEFKKVRYQLEELESENRVLKINSETSEINKKKFEEIIKKFEEIIKNLERNIKDAEDHLKKKKKKTIDLEFQIMGLKNNKTHSPMSEEETIDV